MTMKEILHGGFPSSESKITREVKGKAGGKKKKKPLDTPAPEVVSSPQSTTNAAPPQEQKNTMAEITLTLNEKPRKSTRIVIYESALNSVQFLRTAFGPELPKTLVVSGEGFAEPKEKVAKVKETPEERKARLAALPKLTLAEKVAKAEERLAAQKAKLAKQTEAPATM